MLANLLQPDAVCCRIDATSRKRVLQTIAEHFADEQVSSDQLFDELMGRERLGSTGLGDGVAIPHCRADVAEMRVCFMTTEAAVDYEASDGQLVDLFFVLIVPKDEHELHLQALAQLASVFAQAENRAALRACRDDASLARLMHTLLQSSEPTEH